MRSLVLLAMCGPLIRVAFGHERAPPCSLVLGGDDTVSRHWSDLSNLVVEVSCARGGAVGRNDRVRGHGRARPCDRVCRRADDGRLARRHVVADLRRDYRCVLPTLPLGAHRRPMRPDADLSMRGMVELLGEFIQALDLREITLAMNDWGGPLLLVGGAQDERIARPWCARARRSTTCRQRARRSCCHYRADPWRARRGSLPVSL